MTIEIKLDYLPGHKNNQCFNVSILVLVQAIHLLILWLKAQNSYVDTYLLKNKMRFYLIISIYLADSESKPNYKEKDKLTLYACKQFRFHSMNVC